MAKPPAMSPFPPEATREAIRGSMQHLSQDQAQPLPLQYTYAPVAHAPALDPQNTIVVGIRGAGKSVWTAALASDAHRAMLEKYLPRARVQKNLRVSIGFAADPAPERRPTPRVLADLLGKYRPADIWRAVIAFNSLENLPVASTATWPDKVEWVSKNTEDFERRLSVHDQNTGHQDLHLFVFDALDRMADEWDDIFKLLRGLLEVALEVRSYRSLRLKLFLRPDMLENETLFAFRDASKLLANKVSLTWSRTDLFGLLWQHMGNEPSDYGDRFRSHCECAFTQQWTTDPDKRVWIVPDQMRVQPSLQETIFHSIAGDAMGSGSKRGKPYSWLPNHLMDGMEQVSPRSFCAALQVAALGHPPESWPYAIHFKDIHEGVRKASDIRVNEICEDYPWVATAMDPLRGMINVPCEREQITQLWSQGKTLERLEQVPASTPIEVKLKPRHLRLGTEGVMKDLVELGVLQHISDGRFQMPDVYRVAFGIGRKGGVKPLK